MAESSGLAVATHADADAPSADPGEHPLGTPRWKPGRGSRLIAQLLTLAIRAYQLVPQPGPPRCRYYPSCSAYAVEALRVHGAVRGGWLAACRVGRCHPFTPGGVDHVPPPRPRRQALEGSLRP